MKTYRSLKDKLVNEKNEHNKMKELYCFDFDGTVTSKDTMFLFLKYYNRQKFFFWLTMHIPLILLMKIKLTDAETVKKSLIASVLKNEKKEMLDQAAYNFFKDRGKRIVRKNVINFINSIDNGAAVYLVTASLDIWTKPFADYLNCGLIATVAEYKNGVFTGNFLTPNCNGQEKVNRIKKEIDLSRYESIIAFGDSSGDKPMLNWADKSYFRFFN